MVRVSISPLNHGALAAAQTSAAIGDAEPMKVPRVGVPDRTAAARAP